ncbi:MAG TPA: amino acid ABC transporter substrate-binding protein [Micromonosporaceae bacterium]|nr:amino acid ABC transporter substrate-binding protein [Micromonosporaceae bacterium]
MHALVNRVSRRLAGTTATLLLIAPAVLAGCAGPEVPAAAGTINIGMVVSRTGVYKTVGDDMVNGFQLYLDQHSGKLGGQKIELLIEDEADGGEIAKTLTEKLIQRNNIQALTGVVGGKSVEALAPLLGKHKVPLVGANARPTTTPDVTWMWHSSYISTEPGIAMGKYVAANAGGPVWVVCPDYQGGYDECNGFVGEFVKAGGTLANTNGKPDWTPFPQTSNFQPYLTKILASNATAVYTFYAGAPAISFVKQYKEFIGAKLPLFAAGFLTEGTVLAAQGEAAKGIRNSMNYAVDLDNRANRTFVADYQAKYKTMPTTFSMASYDAAAILDKAITAAAAGGKPVTGETINAALASVGQIDSPRGPWTFASTTHTPIQTWYLREVQHDGGALTNVMIQELATIGG